jgi:hypothetical protein
MPGFAEFHRYAFVIEQKEVPPPRQNLLYW